MINLCNLGQVYIVCGKTDMRKGIDTLAFLVKEKFEMDPFAGQVYLFAAVSRIVLKLCIGMVKDTGFYTSDSKMEN